MRILALALAALALSACSRDPVKTTEAAATPAAKAPAFPPALIRDSVAGIKTRCETPNAAAFDAGDIRKAADTPAGAVYGVNLERFCPDAMSRGLCGTGGCENPAFLVGPDGTARVLAEGPNRGWEVSKDGGSLVLFVHGGECGLAGPAPCRAIVNLANGKIVAHDPPRKTAVGGVDARELTQGYCLGLHIAVAGRAADVLGKTSDLAVAGSIYAGARMVDAGEKIKDPTFQHEMKNGSFMVDHYLRMGQMSDNRSEADQLTTHFEAGDPLFNRWFACIAAFPPKG